LGKIVEYFLKKDAVSIRAGEVFGILFLLLLGFTITRFSEGPMGQVVRNFPINIGGTPVQPGEWIGDSHTFSEEAAFPIEASTPIRIENAYGSVSVSPGSEREVRVRLKKVISGEAARAGEVADEIQLEGISGTVNELPAAVGDETQPGIESDAAFLTIRTNRDSISLNDIQFNTDMEILVPQNSNVQVRNIYGEISVSEINGDLDLSTTHRALDVRDCTGNFEISTRFSESRLTNLVGNVSLASRGRAYLEDIKGDVNVTNEYSPTEISAIDGAVTVSSTEGSIRIENVTKPVVIDGRGTQVRVRDLKDTLKVTASHRTLDVSDVDAEVDLETRYCQLTLKNIGGNVDIRSNSDRVHAADVRGRFGLKARASSLRLNGVRGNIDIQTSLKNVIVNDLEGSCSIVNEYADVRLSALSLQAGEISVKNRNGSIDLTLPRDSSFAMEAVARNGRVESSYGGLEAPRNEGNNGVLQSRVQSGEARITLETEYGNISISEGAGKAQSRRSRSKRPQTRVVYDWDLNVERFFSILGRTVNADLKSRLNP
jgi:hypothetical protein